MIGKTLEDYRSIPDSEAAELIARKKAELGGNLMILGHHYQTDPVIGFADIRGDSLDLSRHAAQSRAGFIVFCGVHFMAESADILTREEQVVALPDPGAGCPMAEMASAGEMESAWIQLSEVFGKDPGITPVTYINSRAEVKAFCGTRGGIACTSANAPRILDWAFRRSPRVLFLPDQHLGRNTSVAKGIPLSEITLWDPSLPFGGNTVESLRKSRVILWKGHCHVHTRFSVNHVEEARRGNPGARVIVHPESPLEVVQASDSSGSTGGIIEFVKKAGPGSTIVIGTEINLIARLAREFPDRKVVPLTSSMCPNMFRNNLQNLLFVLDRPRERNVIRVPPEIAAPARTCLSLMLEQSK